MVKRNLQTIKDVQPRELYAICEVLEPLRISRSHFRRKAAELGLQPTYKPSRGRKPFYTGAQVIKLNNYYN